MKDKLKQFIENLPSNGEWWNSSNKQTFYNQAKNLLAYGILEEDVMEILESLYRAVCSEYGE